MKKTIGFMIALVLAMPAVVCADEGVDNAFRQQQQTERRAYRQQRNDEDDVFRESLKGMTAEDKDSALKERRTTQYQENQDFMAEARQGKADFLKSRLAKNTMLTDEQKGALITVFEEQCQNNDIVRGLRYTAAATYFERIARATALTQEQRIAAIITYFEEQRSSTAMTDTNKQ